MSAQLFREVEVRGTPAEGMTEAFAERLGRALGTLARRQGLPEVGFVIGREEGLPLAKLRDGLVRGLVLSGQHVLDVGVVDARAHEFALVHLARPAGVFIAGQEGREPSSAGCEILLGGGPLVGEALRALRDITLAGDFSAGAGLFELVDVGEALREAERQGNIPGLGSDTQVV